MLGENIKVHFAGSDYQQSVVDSLVMADVHYRLFTVYPAIAGKKKDADFTDKTGVCQRQQSVFNHVIMDSGLFTLMFGGSKGTVQTKQSLLEWQDKLISFVKQNHLDCTCVEIDCQKVLGVEEAWFFRRRMREKLPNKQINVFHYEDGKDGLNRLIEFSDYIAISVPEIRIVHSKTFREDTHKLACYIKSKKPEIDIHLLGCTDKKMLCQNRFCTSADSSTWTGVYRFANIQGRNAHCIKKEKYKEAEETIKKFIGETKWNQLPDKSKRRCVWELISAQINRAVYEKYAGDQS